VFFDGYCVLCNGFVDYLLQNDTKKKLHFASLQGETAKKKLAPSYLHEVDTVIFIDNNQDIFIKSAAVIAILKTLGGLWKLISLFSYVPVSLRDNIYDFVARKRYGWFGKRDQCRLPKEEEKDRILP
jgi:predicted DCC family thiol-disulfide oxidoreductase YuxK